jgi:hypothetical protein
VFLATLFESSPVGLPVELEGLSDVDARRLQQVAAGS